VCQGGEEKEGRKKYGQPTEESQQLDKKQKGARTLRKEKESESCKWRTLIVKNCACEKGAARDDGKKGREKIQKTT